MKNKQLMALLLVSLLFSSLGNQLVAIQANKAPIKPTQKEYVLICHPYDAGLFSHFLTVVGFIFYHNRGDYTGLRVNFENRGLYYEASRGPNWWEYYFEPVILGNPRNAIKKIPSDLEYSKACFFAIKGLTRQKAFQIIQNNIRVKPYLKKEVDEFVDNKFDSNFVIGVHYRGTDKVTSGEADLVSYDEIVKTINEQIQERGLTDYKIFVATDELAFLNYMESNFPEQIICQKAVRSEDDQAIHLNNPHPYQSGREAVIDMLLLSRCQLLVRTISNLSVCSSYFNPSVPVIVHYGNGIKFSYF
jgi:hypothetical protein